MTLGTQCRRSRRLTINCDDGGRVLKATRGDVPKQAMREETERLVREAIERKAVTIKHVEARVEVTCGKCGARNRVSLTKGQSRVRFACKECGHEQSTL